MKLLPLLFIIFARKSQSFPENLAPRSYLTARETAAFPVFSGNDAAGVGKLFDVQDLTFVGNKLLIAARNAVFVLSRFSLEKKSGNISFEQVLYWFKQNETRCEETIGSRLVCQNYIRVVAPLNHSSILLCGTNAASPSCRIYEWDGTSFSGKFEVSGSRREGDYKVPYNQVPSLVYKYSGGYMFTATSIRLQNEPKLIRTPVTRQPDAAGSNPALPTLSSPLGGSNPYFVGMAESSDKVFVFFREEALEASDANDKVVFSRVGQLCKADKGGDRSLLRSQWTTFFRARLNCSIPGSRPFYFNEIHDVTEAVQLNGKIVVFAAFTTPENSIAGSAVCAFTMLDIKAAMAGNFKQRGKSSPCWSKEGATFSPHPATCRRYLQDAEPSKSQLQFVTDHPIMAQTVPMLGGNPLFTQTQGSSRFTALNVETNVKTAGNENVSVIYIGTNDGKLLKVVSDQSLKSRATFAEEWDIFQSQRCLSGELPGESPQNEAKRVRKVTLVEGSDVILVTFKYCVISVPKQLCSNQKCESSCVRSGNPFCGWLDGECVAVTSYNRDVIKQDLFSAVGDGSCSENSDPTLSEFAPSCGSCSAEIVLPLVLGSVLVFTVVLLAFVLIKGRGRFPTKCKRSSTPSMKEDPADNRVQSVLLGPTGNSPSPTQSNIEASANNNSNCDVTRRHVVGNLANGDTSWADDVFENSAASEPVYENLDPLGGARHDGGKLFQVVKPLRLGYGATDCGRQVELEGVTSSSGTMSNPNYLPVSPLEPETFVYPQMTSFSPGDPPAGNFPDPLPESDSMGFPPPPSCALSPTSVHISSFSAASWRPSPSPGTATKRFPATGDVRPLEGVKESTSGDSATSGFESSSQTSFRESKKCGVDGVGGMGGVNGMGGVDEVGGVCGMGGVDGAGGMDGVGGISGMGGVAGNKSLIVAKGILSAQSIVGAKKKRPSSKRFDDVISSASPSMTSFVASSDEDFEEQLRNFAATPGSASSSSEEEEVKEKRSFFKRKKRKAIMTQQGVIVDEDAFRSPAFDEDPIVPRIDGWEEIEYIQRHSAFERRSVDDSIVTSHRRHKTEPERRFCTIRPKKIRRSAAVPVPTPNVPL